MWENVDENLLKATSKSYDLAINTLKDLHDLSVFQGKEADFKSKMHVLREPFVRKRGLLERLDKAGF